MPDFALWPQPLRHRACRVVVLAAGPLNDHGPGGQSALQNTLDDVARDLQPGERLEVLTGGFDLGLALAQWVPGAASDLAWVMAGTRVQPGWRLALQEALHADTALATVSALHLSLPWFSPLPPGGSAKGREPALAGWLSAHAPSDPIELGAPMVACGILRAQALTELLEGTGRENQPGDLENGTPESGARRWWQVLADHGWLHAVSRRVLAYGEPPRNSGAPLNGGLQADGTLWAAAHPLTGLRHAVGDVLRDQAWGATNAALPVRGSPAQPCAPIQPVRLHVAHSWGGGLSKWVRDFIHSDEKSGRGRGLILRSVGVFGAFGQRLALYAGAEDTAPLRYWELGVPIHATSLAHLEVRQILREIVQDFGVDQVVVSSLIGHSLDVLQTGLPTVVVAHDHHPFCITLYAHFEGECRECSGQQLRRCMRDNSGHRFFRGVQPQEWEALRRQFASLVRRLRLPIAAPTTSVAARWQSMMPELDPAQFSVIGHGIELPATPAYEPPTEGPLRIVVLGRLSEEKGAALLAQMREGLLTFAELLLVGCGERLDAAWRHPRVTVIPHYRHEELPNILAGLAPHVGLLMSTVPETFSYTLSELWHARIPVVATDGGALGDRVVHEVTGFLEPPDPVALLQRLRLLHEQRSVLGRLRQTVATIEPRGLEAMVADYERLLPHTLTKVGVDGQGPQPPQQVASPLPAAREHHRGRRAIHVNPEVTWRQALQGFWHYTCHKASRSPRIPHWIRDWFARKA